MVSGFHSKVLNKQRLLAAWKSWCCSIIPSFRNSSHPPVIARTVGNLENMEKIWRKHHGTSVARLFYLFLGLLNIATTKESMMYPPGTMGHMRPFFCKSGREVQSLKSQLSLAQNYVLKVTGKPIPREVLLGDFTKARANFRGDTWRKLEEFFNVFLALFNSDELFTQSSLIMFDLAWLIELCRTTGYLNFEFPASN